MSTDHDRVRDYYAGFAEWERLETPEGVLEFRRACALLAANLAPGSRILDLGGGPGRYSIELARQGHRVVLADVSPALLETARAKIAAAGTLAGAVESLDEVNATDLRRYPDDSFDAVVAFGPFYHLVEAEERASAVAEIARVLRKDGRVLAAFIPRQSGLIGLLERAAASPAQVPEGTLTAAASSGAFHNGSRSGFQEGHFPTVEEHRALFARAGFAVTDVVSLRAFASRLEAKLGRLAPGVDQEVFALIEALGRDPAFVATGGHAVLVGRKSAAPQTQGAAEIIGIDHIYLAVSLLERSETFYDRLLQGALGFRKNSFVLGGDRHVQYFNRHFGLVLRPSRPGTPAHDPYAPGLHHLCLRVEGSAEVDRVANALTASGLRTSAPQLFPEYAPDYYATSITDPDGLRLEITNFREERKARMQHWLDATPPPGDS